RSASSRVARTAASLITKSRHARSGSRTPPMGTNRISKRRTMKKLTERERRSIEDEVCMMLHASRDCLRNLTRILSDLIDYCTPFDGRHNENEFGFVSELRPFYTRIGKIDVDSRICEIKAEFNQCIRKLHK